MQVRGCGEITNVVVIQCIAGEVTSDTVYLDSWCYRRTITQLTKLKEGPALDLSATAEVTGDKEEPTTYHVESKTEPCYKETTLS